MERQPHVLGVREVDVGQDGGLDELEVLLLGPALVAAVGGLVTLLPGDGLDLERGEVDFALLLDVAAAEGEGTLGDVVDLVARVSPDITAPIVLFTYFNPIYQRGFEPFVKSIAAAGAKGLLVPDIPLEETGELSAVCKANGIDLVLLSTPTTPEERMAKIADKSNGFIYLVSLFLFTYGQID